MANRSLELARLIRERPATAAVVSKLIAPSKTNTSDFNQDGSKSILTPDANEFKRLSEEIALKTKNSELYFKLLPDLKLATEMLLAAILCPKDMNTCEVIFNAPEELVAADLSSQMISETKVFINQYLDIQKLLPAMIADPLFFSGSWTAAVIPENSLDDIINGSIKPSFEAMDPLFEMNVDKKERQVKHFGLLGPAQSDEVKTPVTALEAFFATPDTKTNSAIDCFGGTADKHFSVTDNFNVLKMPGVMQQLRRDSVLRKTKTYSAEADMSDAQFSRLVYKNKQREYKPFYRVKLDNELSRSTIGNPMVLKLPSESVIPVCMSGNPKEHVGYFVLLDINGYPVSAKTNPNYYQMLGSSLFTSGQTFSSAMVNKVNNQMSTGDQFSNFNMRNVNYAERVFSDILEANLLARLKNGVYGEGVDIVRCDDVYRTLLARSLEAQHTQILFIPSELMSYIAYDYTDEGVGKSLTSDNEVLLSLRVMTMFANTMASVRNSIGRKTVTIKLDPESPDPTADIEKTRDEIIRSNQMYFPLYINSVSDVTNWLQTAGYDFAYEGHPSLPDMSVTFSEGSTNLPKPDTDLEENLRKRSIQAFFMNPEQVDAGASGVEFATSLLFNNLMLSKRVKTLHDRFMPQVTEFYKKYILNSSILRDKLVKVVTGNIDKVMLDEETEKENKIDRSAESIANQVVLDFMNGLEITLPAPDEATLESQTGALKAFVDDLEPALDAWINDKIIVGETAGDMSEYVSTFREVIKAGIIREYMVKNGIFPEIGKMIERSAEGKLNMEFAEEQAGHINSVILVMSGFMQKLQDMIKVANTVKENALSESGDGNSSSSSDDSSTSSPEGGTDEFGGAFDEGNPLDEPAEENPEETETPPEQAETDEPAPETETPEEPAKPEGEAEPKE